MNARVLAATLGLAAILLIAGGATAVDIATVPVGNPGNADDIWYRTGYGAVNYEYNIGKYEVSNAEYVEFLNAADPEGTDPHDLYNSNMGTDSLGGITFHSANPSGMKYFGLSGWRDKPVIYVSFWDACRFANWLHNGQGSGDTETGAYTLTADGITNNIVTRNPGWQWAVTSVDEWYKAAYYDGGSGVYYDYATGSNTEPTGEAPPGTDMTNGSANFGPAPGGLTDVGAYTYKPSDSPYGTYDQNGNVWEWTDPIYLTYWRAVRGTSFMESGIDDPGSYRGMAPTTEYRFVGFRVSEVPEPGCAALLLTSVVGLLARRRRR